MKFAVIDVGSNSVRLLLDGKKTVLNTQLAEKMEAGGFLLPEAVARTAEAVRALSEQAATNGAEVRVFATEAVRSASNKGDFVAALASFGLSLDILSAEREASVGFRGAYCGKGRTQAVLDVGGASSELAVGDDRGLIYSHSLPIGGVRLKDISPDRREQESAVRAAVAGYRRVPDFSELLSIGGTTSSLVAVRDKVEPYLPEKIHMQKLTRREIDEVVTFITETPPERRKDIAGLHPRKIFSVPAGGIIVMGIMDYLGLNEITVSENDNLEGYLEELLKAD